MRIAYALLRVFYRDAAMLDPNPSRIEQLIVLRSYLHNCTRYDIEAPCENTRVRVEPVKEVAVIEDQECNGDDT
jgi:hypothetical protein